MPNTAGIGLKEPDVELDERGHIHVNGRLETTAPDVWAVGECAGSPRFTHLPKMISESYETISQVEIEARAIG
jgi:pyruvate/2-oxoglutarate dehydrogenase complex dihydrolipoamide dehydrogenase (E3) component